MTDASIPARRVTRHDVAVRAGVSDAVVSYTLNGGAPVAPATAERVRQAVEELGYRPSMTARALKSGSTLALGLIAPAGGGRVFANPFFTEFASEIGAAAEARGRLLYTSMSASSSASMTMRFEELAARQVDGVVLLAGEPVDVEALQRVGVPWVLVNGATVDPRVDSIGVDLHGGAVAAVQHLLAHGHRGIAFVGAPVETHSGVAEPRILGWEAACRDGGQQPGPAIPCDFTREDGHRAGLELLALPDRPSAVFAASDLIAIGLLRAFHEAGVRIPDDIAVVSFDGTWESAYTWPSLTTMRQPIAAMATAGIERLLEPAPPAHRLFATDLVLGGSCGPHPA
jgi:LacI family transcriptional regulator